MTAYGTPAQDHTELGLGVGWKQNPEWPTLVLSGLRDALRSDDMARLAGFATVGIEIARSGHLEVATAISQLLYVRLTGGRGVLAEDRASTSDVVHAVLAREPEPATLDFSADRLAGVLADATDMDDEAARLNWRAGEGFAGLDDPGAAGLAFLDAARSSLWLDDWEQAATAAARADECFGDGADARGEVESLAIQAEASIAFGDLLQAEAALTRARALLPIARSAQMHALLARLEARLEIERGNDSDAHLGLRHALRVSRRTDDHELQAVILEDLAILTESTKGPRAAAAWWSKALTEAEQAGPRRELEIARGAGLNAFESGELNEAIGILGRALERQADTKPNPEFARVKAEWGALVLTRALRALQQQGRASAEPDLDQGEAALKDAIREFVTRADIEWTGIAARNLKVVWRLQGKQCEGSAWLRRAVPDDQGSQVAAELLREAALLGVGCPDQTEWAADWLLSAVGESNRESWAMTLALESEALDSGDLLQDTDGAVALMTLACEVADTNADWGYGDLLNDLGVRLSSANRHDEAEDAFEKALEIARQEENRALQSLALANLAELRLLSRDADVARQQFTQSAELAEEVGDIDRAIESLAGAARIEITDDLPDAEETARKMADLAGRGASPEGLAVVLSTEASAAFTRGAYVTAFTLWRRAARLDEDNRGERLAYALNALAINGNRTRFERELERAAGTLERDSQTIDFCEGILRAAPIWASMGDGDAAGMVIATSTALAGATLTSTKLSMDARSLFMRSLGTMRVGQLVASSIEEQGVAIAEPFDRHLTEILGEEAAGAVRWVLRWADDESDLDDPEIDDESSPSSDA